MPDPGFLIVFAMDGTAMGQTRCQAVPGVGDFVDLGEKQWIVVKRVWTPLSEADTDVIVEVASQ